MSFYITELMETDGNEETYEVASGSLCTCTVRWPRSIVLKHKLHKSSGLFCMAVDVLSSGKRVMCLRKLADRSGASLVQVHARWGSPRMLCALHEGAAFLHRCCPLCNQFCTTGWLFICSHHDALTALPVRQSHYAHVDCVRNGACPHCGAVDSGHVVDFWIPRELKVEAAKQLRKAAVAQPRDIKLVFGSSLKKSALRQLGIEYTTSLIVDAMGLPADGDEHRYYGSARGNFTSSGRPVLLDDVSRGRERVKIPLVNEEDSEKLPSWFTYTSTTINPYLPRNLSSVDFVGIDCECSNGTDLAAQYGDTTSCLDTRCPCVRAGSLTSGEKAPAEKTTGEKYANLSREIGGGSAGFGLDTSHYSLGGLMRKPFLSTDATPCVECTDMCACAPSVCGNRVTQQGLTAPLEVFRTKSMGWGVRCLGPLWQGQFVCEYVGEVVREVDNTDSSNDYVFEIDSAYTALVDLKPVRYVIDAQIYGNASRFINHSCEPNMITVNVASLPDLRFPRIALFALRDVAAGEQLFLDYEDKYWRCKQRQGQYCLCRQPECRFPPQATGSALRKN